MRWALILVLTLAGCRQEMAEMPRLDPLEVAPMFQDGSAALRPPPGTVPRDADLAAPPEALPARVPLAMLKRGRERYGIFCAPCHSPVGNGRGMIVRRGFPEPPSFHAPRLVAAPDRHFYEVITHGYGAMFPYAARVPPDDRWAIVAYIRALQLSERVPAALVDAGLLPEER